MLITFEGIDGCGKSTQAELLAGWFRQKGVQVSHFREPGGTSLSEKIRELLLDRGEPMHPVTELLLFSAARSELVFREVLPRLGEGEVVILDRFFDSTTAYQGYGRASAQPREIDRINRIASHGVEPDLTFYLKIDPELARNRLDDSPDRMESSGEGFFRKVAAGFDRMASASPRFVTLDGSLSVAEIHTRVTRRVEGLL